LETIFQMLCIQWISSMASLAIIANFKPRLVR
jgi:hypothetical protein